MVRSVNTVQAVNTNFPNINPAHTVYPQRIQPAQPIPKPSFQEELDTRANQENLNLPEGNSCQLTLQKVWYQFH